MAYIALKAMDGPGGVKRLPGDALPEAASWRNPRVWVDSHWVRWVPDEEVRNGRWVHYEGFAAGGSNAALSYRPPAKAPAIEAPAKAEALVVEAEPLAEVSPDAREELSGYTKEELLSIARSRGLKVSAAMAKAVLVEALLSAE